jgi:hypothetical protein
MSVAALTGIIWFEKRGCLETPIKRCIINQVRTYMYTRAKGSMFCSVFGDFRKNVGFSNSQGFFLHKWL